MKAATKAAIVAVCLCLAACSDPVGTHYKNIDDLTLADEWHDWVVVGSFGPNGPFTLTNTKLCEVSTPCHFSHNGQAHSYSGFDGFELMVLRLESEQGTVSHIVLRGAQKYGE